MFTGSSVVGEESLKDAKNVPSQSLFRFKDLPEFTTSEFVHIQTNEYLVLECLLLKKEYEVRCSYGLQFLPKSK